ncbi:hypothetical protein RHGRI_020435 [Rhododendron griersonianum]|uniref:BHLH domain-containing protein n=1 Tax=Rhododendron griersonianum TaxID=479676 RepID=A0AAV6JKK8_9ERIC|nr:hypothetical protein RHGRI_020435 [Rhododendron griersonianum]
MVNPEETCPRLRRHRKHPRPRRRLALAPTGFRLVPDALAGSTGLRRVEALVEEVPTKQVPSRSSLKRGRAAEGGGAGSMKKMKALQNLIPNSNKTDKASMLDDAIEYLKQLQLQVHVC